MCTYTYVYVLQQYFIVSLFLASMLYYVSRYYLLCVRFVRIAFISRRKAINQHRKKIGAACRIVGTIL